MRARPAALVAFTPPFTAQTARLLLGACALLCACQKKSEPSTSDPEPSYEPLVLSEGWSSVARADDPFIAQQPAAPSCVGPEFSIENGWLEIDTGACNWVTLAASALGPVTEGAPLRITVSHYDLDAPAPAEAELALTLGGCSAWSKAVPIPGPAAVYVEPFNSPCALPSGGELLFHLNNHGQNNWQLQELAIAR
jgi:hypothetical protein